MLARLHVLLPFSISLPEGAEYKIYSYDENGYEIRIFPPVKSDQHSQRNDLSELEIDEKLAFQANALRIDFIKEDFDRHTRSECDPPLEFIQNTINSFIVRLRFVTSGFQIKTINLSQTSWRIQYLNNDETELQAIDGLISNRGAQAFQFSFIALTPKIWDDIYALPIHYSPPEWNSLYLDAVAALPNIGVSIVLAATSLEVFVSQILDLLAQKSTISPHLWQWINNREWLREPTLDEQYNDLLHMLLGFSLKDEANLWNAYKNIKKARNSFVHEGVAKIGNNALSEAEVTKLVHKSEEIVNFIKSKLPEDLRWPEYHNEIKFKTRNKIFRSN